MLYPRVALHIETQGEFSLKYFPTSTPKGTEQQHLSTLDTGDQQSPWYPGSTGYIPTSITNVSQEMLVTMLKNRHLFK